MQKTLAYLSLVLAFVLGFFVCFVCRRQGPGPVDPEVRIDTLWLHDTLRLPAPKPKTAHVIDSVLVPVRDTIQLHDTTFIAVPISQTYYSEKEYEAWVSGYRAKLDSLHIYQQTAIVEIPVYKTVTKRWGLGVQAGVTYQFGQEKNRVLPYVGVGISYNLITF